MRSTLCRFLDPVDASILLAVKKSGTTAAAASLGFTQGRVRHRYCRSVQVLRKQTADLVSCLALFT